MLSPEETIECLELAKQRVARMAWALGLHIPGGISGGRHDIVVEGENINGWIDNAIDRLRATQTDS